MDKIGATRSPSESDQIATSGIFVLDYKPKQAKR